MFEWHWVILNTTIVVRYNMDRVWCWLRLDFGCYPLSPKRLLLASPKVMGLRNGTTFAMMTHVILFFLFINLKYWSSTMLIHRLLEIWYWLCFNAFSYALCFYYAYIVSTDFPWCGLHRVLEIRCFLCFMLILICLCRKYWFPVMWVAPGVGNTMFFYALCLFYYAYIVSTDFPWCGLHRVLEIRCFLCFMLISLCFMLYCLTPQRKRVKFIASTVYWGGLDDKMVNLRGNNIVYINPFILLRFLFLLLKHLKYCYK
jgi:hypothetical protein